MTPLCWYTPPPPLPFEEGPMWRFADELNVFSDGVTISSGNLPMLADLYGAYQEFDPDCEIIGGTRTDDAVTFWAAVDLKPAIRAWIGKHYPSTREAQR